MSLSISGTSTSTSDGAAKLFSTYKQVGKAEDVSDLISNITPFDTPFTTLIKSEKMSARTHEWQEDALADAGVNKAYEGYDASFIHLNPTVLRSNRTQILTKACVISNTSDAIKTYGRAKETALQLAKKMKEIKRDLEYAYVYGTGAGRDATDANTAGTDVSSATNTRGQVTTDSERAMKSAAAMIDDGHKVHLVPKIKSETVASGAATADAHIEVDATYTEKLEDSADWEGKLLDLHETLFEAGSDADVCMIPPGMAQIVAGFMDAGTRRRDAGMSREVVNVVDIYISPYGTVKFVINRHQNPKAAFLLDPSMWRSMVLRPFTRTLLAPTGDHTKHFLVGEYSLKNMNYKSSGMMWQTTFTGGAAAGDAVTNDRPTAD